MGKKTGMVVSVVAVMMLAAGCATTRRSSDGELESLRNQVTMLEMELADKDQQIESLRDETGMRLSASTGSEALGAAPVVSKSAAVSGPSTKQIQIALMNSGFNPGTIDGKMGAKTREAIKGFQKANGLKVDGKVGSQTWSVLKKYLKVK